MAIWVEPYHFLYAAGSLSLKSALKSIIFKLLASAGILVRKMDNYGIKNSLRVTIGKNDENKKLILKLKKAINVW